VKNLDAIIIHVGTNDIADAKSNDSITADFSKLTDTIAEINPEVKLIVSSIIPRKEDKRVNDKIQTVNRDLQNLCKEKGHLLLDNDSCFSNCGRQNTSPYRDHIYLKPNGDRLLGISILTAIRSILRLLSA